MGMQLANFILSTGNIVLIRLESYKRLRAPSFLPEPKHMRYLGGLTIVLFSICSQVIILTSPKIRENAWILVGYLDILNFRYDFCHPRAFIGPHYSGVCDVYISMVQCKTAVSPMR